MGMARGKFRGGFSFGSSVCFVVFSSFLPFTEGRCVSSRKGLPPSSPSSTASHFLSLLFGARISPSFSSFFQGVVVSCVFSSSLKARRESLSSPSPLLLFSLSFPKQEAKAGGAISPSLTFLPPSAFFLPSSQRASDKEGVDRGEKEEEEEEEEKPGREERERETGWRGKRAHPREGKVPRSGLDARHKKRGGYSVGKGRGRRFVCCLFLCRCCFSSDL